ncbi:butyrophilin subfamily 2 member A1-like [Protopterus annectens]|uniref:butyrophilin subfamily 2 member A1-like n=1 Tax=Protopterus annectens TaxID=7888 RepID=UPI001CFADEFD|nr:butyrophilin subfamily 2 member A1-like [Protopterus annectens]
MNLAFSFWIYSILISLFKLCLSDSLQLNGSSAPIVSTVGHDSILPCYLTPAKRPPDMILIWMKIGSYENKEVLTYNGKTNEIKTGLHYEGKAEIFHEELDRGNVSLKLRNVTIQDDGVYTCNVIADVRIVHIKLQIAAMGEAPVLHMEEYSSGGIEVLCKSKNWFPEPSLEWTDSNRQALSIKHKTEKEKNLGGSFDIESQIILSRGDPNPITCIVKNSVFLEKLESSMEIAENFFPSVSPWIVLFWILLLGYVAAAAVFIYKFKGIQKKLVKADRQKTCAEEEKRKLLEELDTIDKKKDEEPVVMTSDLDTAGDLPQGPTPTRLLRILSLYHAKWRQCCFYHVEIHLEKSKAHKELIVTDNTIGYNPSTTEKKASSEGPPIAVGDEGFEKGKHYWQVQVGKRKQWLLGVISESGVTKDYLQPSQDEHLVGIGMKHGKLSAIHSPDAEVSLNTNCETIGIYLDYEKGLVSFYNVGDHNKMGSFVKTFKEKIYPFFSPGLFDGDEQPLKVCSFR